MPLSRKVAPYAARRGRDERAPGNIMPVTNLLERSNEEILQRTYVVGIFPNEASGLRPMRALCAEVHENWIEDHRYLDMSLLEEQKKQRLRAAA